MTLEKSPHPNAQRHHGSELGTAPVLCQCCPVAATVPAPYLTCGRGTPLGSTGQGRSLQSWGCCTLLSPGAGTGELLALPCLRLQTQTRPCGAPEQQPQTFGMTEVQGTVSTRRTARPGPILPRDTPGSTAGSTPRVPAEPGAFLKANSSVRGEEPQLHPVCHPGTGTLGGQAAGRGSLKEPQLGAEKPSGSWEDAEAAGTGRTVLVVLMGGCEQGREQQQGAPGAGLGAVEDADALGDVLAAQGTRVQPLAAALAAADVPTGQENHLGLGERQRGDRESDAVPEHRPQHGGSWG